MNGTGLRDIILHPFRKDEKQQLSSEQQQDRDFVNDFYDHGLTHRRPYERQWYLNMAYFMDFQWVTWNDQRRILEVPDAPSWRVRIVDNKIMPCVMHTVARLTQNRPMYVVVPAKPDDSSVNATEVSRKALVNAHRIAKMDILNQRLMLWMCIYGTAFKEPYFDVAAGPRMRGTKTYIDDATGQEMPLVLEGKPVPYDIAMGEVDCDILSPFNVIPEAGATTLEKMRRVMVVKQVSLEWIRQVFPESGKFVRSEDRVNVSSLEKQLVQLLGEKFQTPALRETDTTRERYGYATLKILREKPSIEFPAGRCIIVAGDVLLKSGPLPYKFMQERSTLGLVKYDYIPIGERFWGKAPLESMIPPQCEYNRTLSQLIENKNLMSRPKWMAAYGHKIKQTAITSEPGEVVEYQPVGNATEPHPVTPPSIPQYVFQILEISEKDMDDIGLIARVSRGEAPPGVKSGIAISYLQEKDNSVFGPLMVRFEASEAESGTYTLEIIKECYQEPRLLKLLGEDNQVEIEEFMASDDMPTEVWVQSGSTMPTSLAARQQLIELYFEKGILGDPADPRVRMRALRLAEIGGTDILYDENMADERDAKRENKLFERGMVPVVNVFDNHKMHIYFHDLFRKSDKYRNLVKRDPTIAERIGLHCVMHMTQDPEFQAAQAQAQQMKQQQDLQAQQLQQQQERDTAAAEDKRALDTSKVVDDVRRRAREDAGIVPAAGTPKPAGKEKPK